MESAASIDRDESRTLLDALQVGGGGRTCPPYDRGVKYAQACVVQLKDGRWKLFIQSNKQIEMQIIGSLEDIFKELKHATSTREWERQAKY